MGVFWDFICDALGMEPDDISKEELKTWKELVHIDTRQMATRVELTNLSKVIINRDSEITQDCLKLIENTTNPKVFFERLDLLEEKIDEILQFKPYIKEIDFDEIEKIKEIREDATTIFLQRYYEKVSKKAETLKTEKGKNNQFKKYVESLNSYKIKMSYEQIQFYLSKYNNQ